MRRKVMSMAELWRMAKNNYRRRIMIIHGIVMAKKDFAAEIERRRMNV